MVEVFTRWVMVEVFTRRVMVEVFTRRAENWWSVPATSSRFFLTINNKQESFLFPPSVVSADMMWWEACMDPKLPLIPNESVDFFCVLVRRMLWFSLKDRICTVQPELYNLYDSALTVQFVWFLWFTLNATICMVQPDLYNLCCLYGYIFLWYFQTRVFPNTCRHVCVCAHIHSKVGPGDD